MEKIITSIESNKDVKKIITKHNQVREKISEEVSHILHDFPETLLKAPMIEHYVNEKERQEAAMKFIENGNENWIRHGNTLRKYLSDDFLREKIIEIFKNSPWIVEIQKESISQIFPNEFFRKIILNDGDFSDEKIFQLFLLFNAHHGIASYDQEIRENLLQKVQFSPGIDADFFGEREPGFACGGMEKNYLDAANKWEWICLVNGSLFAKFFHRKGTAKKVSYLPAKTYKTNNGYILWENYFYAPSDQQHQLVIEAIKNKEKQIYIPNIAIKSVRPANGITSEQIRNLLQDKYAGSIK